MFCGVSQKREAGTLHLVLGFAEQEGGLAGCLNGHSHLPSKAKNEEKM